MSKRNRPGLRRQREKKTNYYRRLKFLKGRKPRLVVRLFSRTIIGQLVEYSPKGDIIRVNIDSRAIRKLGWAFNCANIPAAYLTGYLAAIKSVRQGIKEAILDIGNHSAIKGSRVFAFAKGAVDGGISLNIGEGMLPDDARLSGHHITEWLKLNHAKPHFSRYKKKDITVEFEKLKERIAKSPEKGLKGSSKARNSSK